MRICEHKIAIAIKHKRNYKDLRNEVRWDGDDYTVLLHGHPIYKCVDGMYYWTMAGYATSTTRSRLRALGIPIVQRGFKMKLHRGWEVLEGGRRKEILEDFCTSSWYNQATGEEVKDAVY